MVITPQFVLILARKKSETVLQGFFNAGVNYMGGMDIKGDYGKAIGSSLNFKITGAATFGYNDVGEIDMSLYTAGATLLASAADPLGATPKHFAGRNALSCAPENGAIH